MSNTDSNGGKTMTWTSEGAGKNCQTWYKIIDDLAAGTPLVALHGGPGVNHEYLLILSDLTESRSIPLVVYDQVGTGYSTHLPEKMGDITFWRDELFLQELDALLCHLGIQENYALLGHSWGEMLGARHAVSQPKGLKKLVLADTPADMRLWVESQNALRKLLPEEVQAILDKHEAAGTTNSKEYEGAVGVFYSLFLCRINPMPKEILAGFEWVQKDPTVYLTMIQCPTLLVNGRYDEAQDSVVRPFFQHIPRVKWVKFSNSSHMPHFEEREWYMEVVGNFLKDD
ncbi:proline-specific peptidase [Gyrodon lividus]|nr:proline-specific peptidase [Gyrodon lividus]